jgi:hypothetical protein
VRVLGGAGMIILTPLDWIVCALVGAAIAFYVWEPR